MIQLKDAQELDKQDTLSSFRNEFNFPHDNGHPYLYFCGNSLGLQPKHSVQYVQQELDDWARFGVLGHEHAKYPWVSYHENLTEYMAEIVGAKNEEVVVMNSLSVNLHLMMVSFYKPNAKRHKILIEYSAFPSDRYAVESQIKFHGFDPTESLLVLSPEPGETYVSKEKMEKTFQEYGDQIALALIGSVNYYTGQAYPIAYLTQLAKNYECKIGFDLAHGAGNLILHLHEDGPDFAVWCSYKYLNAGPGGLSGCFVHERHATNFDLPRFAGWWGSDKASRFKMLPELKLLPGAEGWQLSNPPILPMASLMASLELFHKAGMQNLRTKSKKLSAFLISLIQSLQHPNIRILVPENEEERGCQVSIQLLNKDKSIFEKLSAQRVIADWRHPDVIRVAPVPLYNNFEDVYLFYEKLKSVLHAG